MIVRLPPHPPPSRDLKVFLQCEFKWCFAKILHCGIKDVLKKLYNLKMAYVPLNILQEQ